MGSNVPQWVYATIGILIVGNLGTIFTVMMSVYKLVWWASKVDSRIEKNMDSSIRANKRVAKIEDILLKKTL